MSSINENNKKQRDRARRLQEAEMNKRLPLTQNREAVSRSRRQKEFLEKERGKTKTNKFVPKVLNSNTRSQGKSLYDDDFGRGSKHKSYKPCYKTHPAYNIFENFNVYGGNCSTPSVETDYYVGLDRSMRLGANSYPWNGSQEVLFYIPNMGVPSNIKEFRKLLSWMETIILSGKSIHIGCIGGHGRTGMVLAALTKVMTGDVNATARVRKEYCKKAVESSKQVAWLKKHFDITPVPPRYGDTPKLPKGSYTRGPISTGINSMDPNIYNLTHGNNDAMLEEELNKYDETWPEFDFGRDN